MLNERRMKFRRLWSAFFREWDVLLTPVINTVALPHMQEGESMLNADTQDAHRHGVPPHIQTGPVWDRQVSVNGRMVAYNDMGFWPGLVAGFHLPATVVPIGLTEAGLPSACKSQDQFTATGQRLWQPLCSSKPDTRSGRVLTA